ncbi:hypothetical protein LTR16_010619, partial [Cryomyces antarcticus]
SPSPGSLLWLFRTAPSCFSALPAELAPNIVSFLPVTDLVDGLMRVDRATHHAPPGQEPRVLRHEGAQQQQPRDASCAARGCGSEGWDDTEEHYSARTVARLRGDKSAGGGAEIVEGIRSRPLLRSYLVARVETWALET